MNTCLETRAYAPFAAGERWYNRWLMQLLVRTRLENPMIVDVESMSEDQYEAYREECDSRSSAEYRMRREICGIEIAEIAEALGVRVDTAKRWENPNKGMPPSLRAWAYVDSAYFSLLDAVEAAVQQAEDAEEACGDRVPVRIAYRRGNQPARDGMTVGMSNAVARASIVALTVLGYDASAEWVDDGVASLAASVDVR